MPLAQQADQKYTYEDYLTWPDDQRWEIIAGVAYNMSREPMIKNQAISNNLGVFLFNELCLINRDYRVFFAATDVIFDENNIVQPDVFVVCDRSIITKENIKGAPDIIIDITSPSNDLMYRQEKKQLYETYCVKEYMVFYPEERFVERFVCENNRYGAPDVFNWDEMVRIKTLDLGINLWEVFEKERVA